MKKAIIHVLKVLAIGIACAVAGHILAGCDGSGNPDVSPTDSASGNPCEIPIPIIVVASTVGTKTVSPTDEAKSLCVGWSAASAYADANSCVTGMSAYMPKAQAQAECATSMTAAECADEAHDFVDSAGVKHMYGTTSTAGYTKVLSSFGILTDCSGGGTTPICTNQGSSGGYIGKGCS